MLSRALRGQLDTCRGIAMERVASRSGSRTGTSSASGEFGQPPSRQRSASRQEQNAAAAPVDEFADQFLLRGREVARLHAADDQPLEGEQLFRLGREAVLQLLRILDALAVDLVLRGAQHASTSSMARGRPRSRGG